MALLLLSSVIVIIDNLKLKSIVDKNSHNQSHVQKKNPKNKPWKLWSEYVIEKWQGKLRKSCKKAHATVNLIN